MSLSYAKQGETKLMGTFTFLEGRADESTLLSGEGKLLTTAHSRNLSSPPTDNYQHLSTNRDLAL